MHNIEKVNLFGDILKGRGTDHSKWAVATSHPFMCVADINRQRSQEHRGGGALCFNNKEAVQTAFLALVSSVEPCPK